MAEPTTQAAQTDTKPTTQEPAGAKAGGGDPTYAPSATKAQEESAGLAFGKLSSEFIRTKVCPEMDAFRFATYAGTSGISTADAAALTDGAAVIAALRAATNRMDEDEVPQEGRMLFITPTIKGLVDDLDTNKSKEVMGRFSRITLVPQSRFYTAIKLKDGTTSGEEDGGYTKADGAANINFMILRADALMQYLPFGEIL